MMLCTEKVLLWQILSYSCLLSAWCFGKINIFAVHATTNITSINCRLVGCPYMVSRSSTGWCITMVNRHFIKFSLLWKIYMYWRNIIHHLVLEIRLKWFHQPVPIIKCFFPKTENILNIIRTAGNKQQCISLRGSILIPINESTMFSLDSLYVNWCRMSW